MTRTFTWGFSALVVVMATGCEIPCEANAECEITSYCTGGFCKTDCFEDEECDGSLVCLRGECAVSLIPRVRIDSPPNQSAVDESSFTLEATVEFSGANAVARLTPIAGEECIPVPEISRILDNAGGPQTLVFEEVPARGEIFAYSLEVETLTGNTGSVNIVLNGQRQTGFIRGATVTAPRLLSGEDSSVEISIAYAELQPEVLAYTEPAFGPPTVRRSIATGVLDLTAQMPVARGEQLVWFESPVGNVTERCAVPLSVPPGPTDETEFAMSFLGEDLSDLDLVVIAELDNGETLRCSAKSPLDCNASPDRGLVQNGDETLGFVRENGVYGIAVLPAATTGTPLAWTRVSDLGGHLDFVGPRRIQAELGEVWLAARVWVTGDSVFVEPLDLVSNGMPNEGPTFW